MAAKIELKNKYEKAYCAGLAAFIEAIEHTDPKDEAAFKPILKLALDRFGVTATSLAERVGHSKGTISKWIHTDAMPPQSTREVAQDYILDQLRHQYETMTSSSRVRAMDTLAG